MWIETLEILLDLVIIGLILAGGWALRSSISAFIEAKNTTFLIKADLEALSTQIEALTAPTPPELQVLPKPIQPDPESNPHRFEIEYRILSELWDALLNLQRTILDLQMDANPSEHRAQRGLSTEHIRQFAESYHGLSRLIHRKRPFYPREIFDALVRIMTLSEMGITPPSEETVDQDFIYWENAINRAEEIVDGIDRVCEMIRKRTVG